MQSERALVYLRLGRLLLAVSFLAFGIQEVQTSGHIGDLGLLADWMPAHAALAWLSAGIFLIAGLSTLTGIGLRSVATAMGVVFAVAAVARFAALLPQMGHVWAYRGVMSELFACGAGLWVLAGQVDGAWPGHVAVQRMAAVGLAVFGCTDIVFGTVHLQVAAYIATLIPQWIPARLLLTYFTGIALVAAGLALLARRWVRAAGVWQAVMFFSWVLVVHAPRIAHALHNGDEWNSGFVCLAMSGCALLVAALPRA